MKIEELKDIIAFAIEKEQEAVDFYNLLSGRVKVKPITEELRKIAAVEESHRDRLKKMDVSGYFQKVVNPVQNLKIADYLVDKEPSPDMKWQDLLQMAMRRELASMHLYTDLAKLIMDSPSRQLFENLAAEEGAHKLFFEKLWDEEVLTDN